MKKYLELAGVEEAQEDQVVIFLTSSGRNSNNDEALATDQSYVMKK